MTSASSPLARDLDHSSHRPGRYHPVLGLVRIAIGWLFLWAFIDKLFGLGHSTPPESSWLNGGSPTAGYLSGVEGPFGGLFRAMAGNGWVDWSFMIGQLGLGLALTLGIGVRIAAITGVPLLVMLWATNLPPENNLFMDEHIIYALALITAAAANAGDILGLGRWWRATPLVRRFPILT